MHGNHTQVENHAKTRNQKFLVLGALSLVLTMGAGSSAAIAHTDQYAGSNSKKTTHGSSSHADSMAHSWFWTLRHIVPVPSTTAPEPTSTTTDEPTTPESTTPESTTTDKPSGDVGTASTAGVPSGTVLKSSGSMKITTAGTVVDGVDIKGSIYISASDVTIKNSKVAGSAYAAIQIAEGTKNVRIENVDVDGLGMSGSAGSAGIAGPADVVGTDIKGVENGIVPGSGSTLTGNYIHNLVSPGAPHYDGIQIDGGLSNIVIKKNTIDLDEHSQTSAVMIDNYFGPISNIDVDGNILLGGGYTVYSDGQFSGGSISGVSFTNNQLGKGQFGYASIQNNTVEWSGNVDESSGQAVSN